MGRISYTQGPGQWGRLISQHNSDTGQSHYYGFDHTSNTRFLSDSGGSVTDSYGYKAFGEETVATGSTPNSMRYGGEVGYYRDKIERVYVRARHYEPPSGRWLSRDPIRFGGRESNFYRYVFNGPTNKVDPTGLYPDEAMGSSPSNPYPFGPPPGQGGWYQSPTGQIIYKPPPPPLPPPPPRPEGPTSSPIGLSGGYGNWCGGNHSGPNPALDCVDMCCQEHDYCLFTWREFCNRPNQTRCGTNCSTCTTNCALYGCRVYYNITPGLSIEEAIDICEITAGRVQGWCVYLPNAYNNPFIPTPDLGLLPPFIIP